jgi:hypothetical protein
MLLAGDIGETCSGVGFHGPQMNLLLVVKFQIAAHGIRKGFILRIHRCAILPLGLVQACQTLKLALFQREAADSM